MLKMLKKLLLGTKSNLGLLLIVLQHFLCNRKKYFLAKNLGKTFASLLMLISLNGYSQLPTESFESGVPATWTLFQNNFGVTTWGTTTDGYLGSNAVMVNPSLDNIGAGNTAEYFMVTPQVAVPANGQIRFYTKQGSTIDNGTTYEVRVSTASQPDISGFTIVLDSWTEATLNTVATTYEQKVVTIPSSITPGLNVYIAFVAVNNQAGATPEGDSWFVDNVEVIESCIDVQASDVTFTNLALDAADVSWTHPTASTFEVQYVPQGNSPLASGTVVNGFSTSFSMLSANTSYDVYIKSTCPNTEVSSWAGPFNFTTLALGGACQSAIDVGNLATPYTTTDNLNNYNNGVVLSTPGSGCTTYTNNYANGGKAFYSYTPSTSGVIKITLTPTGGYTGVFVYEGCANVGVACIGGVANTLNTPRVIDLTVNAGTEYIILVSSNYSATASVPYTLTVESPTCPIPTGILASSILETSAVLSWDNLNSLASSWEVAVQPAGTGVPTGAGVNASSNNGFAVSSILGGAVLTPGTNYEVYIRSNCGSGFGEWSTVYNFTTQCTVFPTPFSENFTGATASAPEPCWTPLDINNDGVKWSYLSSAATLFTGNTQNNNHDMIVSPLIDLGSTTPKRLRFKHKNNSGDINFSVVLSTTGVGNDNFTTILLPSAVYNTTSYVEKIINIDPSITGIVNIGWLIDLNGVNASSRLSIDDVIVEDKPACSDPLDVVVSNITTTSADFSWIAGDAETQWEVAIQPQGTGTPTTWTLVSTNSVSSSTLMTLDHATNYEFYVRAYCSSTLQSNWVGPLNFTTLCGVFTVPFYESFNNTDPDTHKFCWSTLNANNDGGQFQISATEVRFNKSFFGTISSFDDWLISPAIEVIGTKALKFKYKAQTTLFFPNPRHGIEVLMSTTDNDPASFSVVMSLMEFTNTDYIEKSIYINANGPVYIAFRVPPTFDPQPFNSLLFLDDVIIEDAPACPNPSALLVSNVTTTTADISWTEGFMENEWEVVVQPINSGVPTSGQTVSATNYNAINLTADTYYECYVKAVCNATDQSEWIGPITFKTLCNEFASPFFESFDSGSPTEGCWIVDDFNADANSWNLNSATFAYEGDHAAAMFTGTNGANDDYLISPTITVTANQRLRFHYRVHDSFFQEDLRVLLSTSGIAPNDFTTVLFSTDDSGVITNTEYKEMIINLPAGVTGNINIAFHVPGYPPNPWNYRGQLLAIDNFIIEDIPSCPAPYNLAVNNITDVEAQLSWESAGSETQWEIYVIPSGEGDPNVSIDALYLTTVSASPYTISGLDPAIKYDFYVRAVCSGSESSEWQGPIEFITKCSFDNLCEYTITLDNGEALKPVTSINVIQNGVVVQELTFPTVTSPGVTPPPATYTIFLCDGVEFSLFWNSLGSAPNQYPNAQVTMTNSSSAIIYQSPLGIGATQSTIYTGVSSCSTVTCPQPTNLAVTENGTLTWTAGGTESQWEVFIQPLANGTLPQSGTIVFTNSYSPTASDFNDLQAGTYEFFVRAICGAGDESYWSGPEEFVRNDASNNAIVLAVNEDESCASTGSNVSFYGATASSEASTCSGTNNGDVWFEFVATQTAHIIELNNFSGNYYTGSGAPEHPLITMSLYKDNNGTLEQLSCSDKNALLAAYSSATEIGATYKVRLTLNSAAHNGYTFNICIKTPNDLCSLGTLNPGFEAPVAEFGLLNNFYRENVVPVWRYNYPNHDRVFYIDALSGSTVPYEGNQCVQVLSPADPYDPTDFVNVYGLYQDFDSSETTQFEYSYAQKGRFTNLEMELLVGPPSGPFVLVEDHPSLNNWQLISGTYDVPAGQNITRFIFRAKDNTIGNLVDAVSITSNNRIVTTDQVLDCTQNSVTVEAMGYGEWTADANNPAVANIVDPTANSTEINNFTASGDYIFYWNTRYCQDAILITYQANDEVPSVLSPINYCTTENPMPLTADAPSGYTLLWYTSATGGVGSTIAPTPDATITGTTAYYVSSVNPDGCESARALIEVNIDYAFCNTIPRGISPNGDGSNDEFDLTGFGVTKLSIYNRYGREVYSFSGDYTKQWNGLTNGGEELPDGTYFYNIETNDGKSVTGWVYIIR